MLFFLGAAHIKIISSKSSLLVLSLCIVLDETLSMVRVFISKIHNFILLIKKISLFKNTFGAIQKWKSMWFFNTTIEQPQSCMRDWLLRI